MHALVRDAYKRILWVGRDYPKGLSFVREKAKEGFFANSSLSDEKEIMKAVHSARWWAKEIEGIIKLHKYRALRQRYGADAQSADLTAQLENQYKGTAFSDLK